MSFKQSNGKPIDGRSSIITRRDLEDLVLFPVELSISLLDQPGQSHRFNQALNQVSSHKSKFNIGNTSPILAFRAFCNNFQPSNSSVSPHSNFWPLSGTVPLSWITESGIKLSSRARSIEASDEIDSLVEVTLSFNLRRPPKFCLVESRGKNGGWKSTRRLTEEDLVKIEGLHLGPVQFEGDANEGRFKPGKWLSYEFKFHLTSEELSALRSTLRNKHLLPSPSITPYQHLGSISDNPFRHTYQFSFRVRYGLECALGQKLLGVDVLETFCAALAEVSDDEREAVLKKLLSEKMQLSMKSQKDIRQLVKSICSGIRPGTSPTNPDRGYTTMIRRIHITPTCVIPLLATPETTNLVLHRFSTLSDRFLRVMFTDEGGPLALDIEDFSSNIMKEQDVDGDDEVREIFQPKGGFNERIRRVLKAGVVVGGRKWRFLAASESQLKERSSWFIAESPDEGFTVESVLKTMGDFSHEKNVAKHCARLGQLFSSVRIPEISISTSTIPDVVNNGYTFTDGVGLTSREVLDACARVFGATEGEHCAVQIRIGGVKGVISCWPYGPPHVDGTVIRVRPSMQKFPSEMKKLGAMKLSKWGAAFLNRQSIMILSSLGIPPSVIIQMFKDQVKFAKSLAKHAAQDNEEIYELRLTRLPVQQLLCRGFGEEPIVKAALTLVRNTLLYELRHRARIRVDKGVYLLGIADELGVLEEDQVFCAYQDEDHPSTSGILSGRCLVFRSPTLHPGDLRRVEAVAHPDLIAAGLKNVIIFSIKGQRDVPNQLSGGDLDGDMFTIVWDGRLIPQNNYVPMDYVPPTLPTVPEVTKELKDEWYITYMNSDNLGEVANAHLAKSDKLSPKHPDCLQLAKFASAAVDFPKTGLAVNIPLQLRVSSWPDYMEKGRNSHESQNLLGIMYRLIENPEPITSLPPYFDSRLSQWPKPSAEYLEEARTLKSQYDHELAGIMRRYDVCEAEVVAGIFSTPRPGNHWQRDDSLKLSLQDAYTLSLVEPFKAKAVNFTYRRKSNTSQPTLSLLALAAYIITNDPSYTTEHELRSFPWIFLDELVTLSGKKPPPLTSVKYPIDCGSFKDDDDEIQIIPVIQLDSDSDNDQTQNKRQRRLL